MKKISPPLDNAPLIEMVDAAIAPVRLEGVEVEGVNWRVMAGDFWVVAGLFGSGKSDFLATAGGLQRPARGCVKLLGHETFTLDEEKLVEHRRRIGMVFSSSGRLFNRLTIAENVALPVRYHHNWTEAEAEEPVREILEVTGLIPFAQEIPSALSPNWQHRAGLARALVLKPEILLLDKPLTGMDFRHQRWTLEFLAKLSEGVVGGRPFTIVATADNIEPWKDVAKQFALLKNNRWQEIGGRTELASSSEALLQEVWTENI
ncbi:MAG: ATP-binding cassette domain-containing protein [Verrucomicrobiota bacterium]